MYAKHQTLINDTLSKKAAKGVICSPFSSLNNGIKTLIEETINTGGVQIIERHVTGVVGNVGRPATKNR